MNRLFIVVALPLLCPALPRAADFESDLLALRSVAVSSEPARPTRVADPATWSRLLERAVSRPTRIQKPNIGGVEYTVYVLAPQAPLEGQACPTATRAENALYVSKPADGAGRGLYPVRLASLCVGLSGISGGLSVMADWDGTILDLTVYKADAPPGGPPDLDQALARLAAYFLDAP